MKIKFWSGFEYTVDGIIIVKCPADSLTLDPNYSLSYEVNM